MRLSAPIYRLKRNARLMARAQNMPLHAALDHIAVAEGYAAWSDLVSRRQHTSPARAVLDHLSPGDLVLLGARPGQGKTLLGMEIAAMATRSGGQGFFFSLEDHEGDVMRRFTSLGIDVATLNPPVQIETSDNISAAYVIEQLRQVQTSVVVVVDYLQLLDQKRSLPPLCDQVRTLKSYAQSRRATIVLLSQIDRMFEGDTRNMPTLGDVRLPNPLDLSLFDKTCFLHDGQVEIGSAA